MEILEKNVEKREKGANIEMILHILRHGDRSPAGILEEYGRERTRKVARQCKAFVGMQDFKVKAYGSPAGPKSEETGMQRSLETAHIYGQEMVEPNETPYKSRPKSLLNYEDRDVLLIDPEYDYDKVYDDALNEYLKKNNLDESYDNLSEEEQKKASFYASNEATRYYLELDTEKAEQSRKEVAGTFAVLIEHYIKMMDKLNSDQKFLFPLGSHTGMIEPFLAEVVIWKDANGKERRGATLDEMGGIFKPSEGFDIILKTDQNGELQEVKMLFDDKKRFGGEAVLDMQKVKELAEFYRELHKKEADENSEKE